MALSRADFDAISELDLTELVDGQVPEGLHLDYKRDAYGTSDADKRELLKDVSAFANANGGHIVIGIDEAEGVASNLYGIKPADIDAEVSRIDQIIRTGIEPRIPGYRLRSIPLTSITGDRYPNSAKLATPSSGLRAKLKQIFYPKLCGSTRGKYG